MATTTGLDVAMTTALLAEVTETGTMLVETATETVVKTVERAGQLVTSGPQLVIVEI